MVNGTTLQQETEARRLFIAAKRLVTLGKLAELRASGAVMVSQLDLGGRLNYRFNCTVFG